jgi:hypothetical protein
MHHSATFHSNPLIGARPLDSSSRSAFPVDGEKELNSNDESAQPELNNTWNFSYKLCLATL